MKFEGKSPNGINQTSINSVSLFVSGSPILNASSESVNVVGNFTASAVQSNVIGTSNSSPLQIKANTQITGSVHVTTFVSASTLYGTLVGDGSGITNIPASSIGDIDRIKSGSAQAIISPNKGFEINTKTSVAGNLAVTGSVNITTNLNQTFLVKSSGKSPVLRIPMSS